VLIFCDCRSKLIAADDIVKVMKTRKI